VHLKIKIDIVLCKNTFQEQSWTETVWVWVWVWTVWARFAASVIFSFSLTALILWYLTVFVEAEYLLILSLLIPPRGLRGW